MIHGYFDGAMTIQGYTSGAKNNVSQVAQTSEFGQFYEQFDARDEYKFYLYDLNSLF